MESNLSGVSSLKEDDAALYIQPHYKETYRLAIYALLCGGKEAYEDFLQAEQISHFLSEEEILFILEHAELPEVEDECEERRAADEVSPSTYFPTESDEEVPDLDLGWPEVMLEGTDTSISLLFHPPRQNTPTIKEVVRKQIQEAHQIIAIAMDVFTDIDIFKEIISATLRGVVVYILLDDSHIRSFLTMSHRVGINIQDLKNLRVRTVQGQQYQCRSGMKFHGGLEQKFLLVDCRTVLYGTYSYSWSFEKIHLSMVLVITGQLVCSYDEEFRRLYARSTVPALVCKENLSIPYQRDTVTLQSPNSSHLSLNQVHMRSRVMHGMRGAQDDRFNSTTMMTRGLSMQERLHQSHYADVGNLVRGHSYGGELQKINSVTRLRMGTKDIGASPERNGLNLRGGGDFLLSNRLSQQHLRHQTRYGADQNLIPFNSETSLHRWKIDTYLNESDMLDASCDAISPLTSPYNSLTGLNEHQSQLIHSRSRDIKSRMEEMRQKRLSLQEYANLRQSQESLKAMYPPLDRLKFRSSSRGLDARQSMTDLEQSAQDNCKLKESDTKKEGDKREQVLTDGHRSASHYDIKTVADRKTMQTYDWHEPLSRTTSAADLDVKVNDAMLKLIVQHPRAMESLTEIPEEKEGSNTRVNSLESESVSLKDGSAEICKDDKAVPKENSVKSSLPADPQCEDQARGSQASIRQVTNSIGSPAPKEGQNSVSRETETAPKTSTGSLHASEAKSSHTEKGQTQPEEPPLKRNNSLRMKVQSLLTSDEKKASKKEEKSFQRKASFRNSSGSKADHSQAAAAEQSNSKGQPPSTPKSQRSSGGPSDTEKYKSPFQRLAPQRSSKKKTAEQEQSSRSALDGKGVTVYQTTKQKAYSRFEYLLTTETIHTDRSTGVASMHSSDKDRGSTLNRHDSGYQTQSSTDNKLGRFMQRVGNLIGKNK
ncbi:protein FAM83B-like [Stegastes partitus]|uniref:Protein FAM83B-like n=1 Tax=Stegastes partitus TaxID=144197 RepID=A0A3B4ZZA4_9TELE|nr:PREDICTED: protein FAM83B-like [Stegastes partitus]